MATTVTPEQRTASARQGASARHDPRTYARSIVSRWPELDTETRAEVRGILSPIVNRAARKAA